MTAGLGALPDVPDAALPRAVRAAGPDERRAYRAALGFERVLLEQVVDAMAAGQSALEQGPHAAAVRGALADALVTQGGLGLAREIHDAIRREQEPA